jgi:hypothetical protein
VPTTLVNAMRTPPAARLWRRFHNHPPRWNGAPSQELPVTRRKANGRRVTATSSYSSDHIVRRQRPPDPLQLELTDRLDCDGILYFH